MRKPLVVLCAAAAALAAGGIAANAPAQEPPDASDISDLSVLEEPAGDNLLGPFPDVDYVDETGAPVQRPRTVKPDASAPSPSKPSKPSSPSPSSPSSPPAEKPDLHEAPEMPRPRRDDRPRLREAPGFARPAADPIAAARQAVSASDVSASPFAPVQQQVLALVNRNRRNHGCEPLTVDRRLISAANRHAAEMARRGYFDHEDSRGERAGARVSDAGYEWRRYGENIARGQDSPYEVVTDWMNSPEHRENILDCRLDEMGVGLAFDADDTTYWVQDFATPR
jgi:uncharacterized protein YkwD